MHRRTFIQLVSFSLILPYSNPFAEEIKFGEDNTIHGFVEFNGWIVDSKTKEALRYSNNLLEQNNCSNLLEQNKYLRNTNNIYEQKINSLVNSRSWRYTKFLRKLYQYLKF